MTAPMMFALRTLRSFSSFRDSRGSAVRFSQAHRHPAPRNTVNSMTMPGADIQPMS